WSKSLPLGRGTAIAAPRRRSVTLGLGEPRLLGGQGGVERGVREARLVNAGDGRPAREIESHRGTKRIVNLWDEAAVHCGGMIAMSVTTGRWALGELLLDGVEPDFDPVPAPFPRCIRPLTEPVDQVPFDAEVVQRLDLAGDPKGKAEDARSACAVA